MTAQVYVFNQNPQAIARGILELISASKMQDAVKNITKAIR